MEVPGYIQTALDQGEILEGQYHIFLSSPYWTFHFVSSFILVASFLKKHERNKKRLIYFGLNEIVQIKWS